MQQDEQQSEQQDRPLPRTKEELLERIERSRAALEGRIAQLREAQLTGPRDRAGWSIADHLVNLGAWERSIAYLLRGRPRHEGLGVPEASYLGTDGTDEDGLNAIIQQRAKDWPLSAALESFRDAHRQLLAALAPLTYDDLLKPYSHYLPDEPGEDDGTPILRRILGNTAWHYEEHRPWIEALVR